MIKYLTPLSILIGAMIISVSIYVGLTKPQQDMIKKKMDNCIEQLLLQKGVKDLKDLKDKGKNDNDEALLRTCRSFVFE